jgi:glutamate synthase (NADPH/NADH) small chain
MPADPKEMENATEEGARFLFQSQPVEIIGNLSEEVTGVRCLRTEPEPLGASVQGSPLLRPGTEFDVPAEVVLVAYGFAPPRLPNCADLAELALDQRGCLAVNSEQMTNLPGVFAAGAIAHWPASMIDVMQDARKAAAAIDHYLAPRRSRS